MTEMPKFLTQFLAEAPVLEQLPEQGQETGVHTYIGKAEVVCEGEVIGHLVNEDPEWIYRPVEG